MQQLQQVRVLVEEADDLTPAAKARLLELVAQAEQEAATGVNAPHTSLGTFQSAVAELEASHPEATAFMNRVAVTLGNMGI
ncbi:MAG: DUF4404 family protein [Prosthecobacter sp.]|uniref:DUF4404 family protein n=1 Tax=Prosthecobacter sp. TaxID=1965333 RepID=UPI0038FF2141